MKPGATTYDITKSANNDIRKLTKKDAVVIWDGSNNISKNNAKSGIKNLANFTKKYTNTNVVVMSAPHRYHLIDLSCLNKEVQTIEKIMKVIDNAMVLDVDMYKDYFT